VGSFKIKKNFFFSNGEHPHWKSLEKPGFPGIPGKFSSLPDEYNLEETLILDRDRYGSFLQIKLTASLMDTASGHLFLVGSAQFKRNTRIMTASSVQFETTNCCDCFLSINSFIHMVFFLFRKELT
jgi:hypothetical protein